MNLNDLFEPFTMNSIHWRIGSTNKRKVQRETGDSNARPTKGIPLAYIDARDAMQRLDAVCGPANWQCRYPFAGCCEVGIKIDNEWVWKANGAGETDIEGKKGQYSDAFKRAAVLWGIGQYLYDLPNVWVDLDKWGKFTHPKLPQWALPGTVEKQISDDPVDKAKIEDLAHQIETLIDSEYVDAEDWSGQKGTELFGRLTNDERIAAAIILKAKNPEGTGKTYSSVFKDIIQLEREWKNSQPAY